MKKKILTLFVMVVMAVTVFFVIAACDEGLTTPNYTVPAGLSARYGQTLRSVTLPNRWEWDEDLSTPVGAIGERGHYATFTPRSQYQYSVTRLLTITVHPFSTPARPTPSAVTFREGLSLADIELPEFWAWTDPDTMLNIGTNQTFPANFERESFQSATNVQITLTINPIPTPATPATQAVNWREGLSLSDIELPDFWRWVNSDTLLNIGANQRFPANFVRANHQSATNVQISVTVNPIEAPAGIAAPSAIIVAWKEDLTLFDVSLPENWAWADSSTEIVVGTNQTFPAIYTRPNHLPTDEIQVIVTAVDVTSAIGIDVFIKDFFVGIAYFGNDSIAGEMHHFYDVCKNDILELSNILELLGFEMDNNDGDYGEIDRDFYLNNLWVWIIYDDEEVWISFIYDN
ncbi:MAG: hypothetical protein FWE22_08115 [Firmicutes bacterium]|nr:hypothetical protein [Bacillota bacterium]